MTDCTICVRETSLGREVVDQSHVIHQARPSRRKRFRQLIGGGWGEVARARAGRPSSRTPTGAAGAVPRVFHRISEGGGHEIGLRRDTLLVPHSVGQLAVAPRSDEPPWRAGACGCGRRDPPVSMPRAASRRFGMGQPCRPPRRVSPVQRSRAGRPAASRSANRCSAASKRRWKHHSGTDCWSGSDPRGRGRGCANAPGPEPVAGPRTAGSLPAPSDRTLRPRPPGTARRKTFARSSFRRPAGAHVRSAGVRIGTRCRFRGRMRP